MRRANELIAPVLLKSPNYDRAHFVKGLILRTERLIEQSSVFFQRAIEINPNYAQAIAFLGYNQALTGQPEATVEPVERAIRLSPRDPQLGVWLGFENVAHLQLGRLDTAIEVSRRAVAANPEYGIAQVHLAIAACLSGRIEEATQALANARRLHPDLSGRFLRAGMVSEDARYVDVWSRGINALEGIGLPR